MLEEIVPVLKHFRDRLYRFFPSRRDVAMELVDALASNRTASSVVELSLSPLRRRNYCIITRVLEELMSKNPVISQGQKQALATLLASVCPHLQNANFIYLQLIAHQGSVFFHPP